MKESDLVMVVFSPSLMESSIFSSPVTVPLSSVRPTELLLLLREISMLPLMTLLPLTVTETPL